MSAEDNLRLDYEQTCQQVRAFTEIRFKLLAFVPALTAAAVALLGNVQEQATVLAVGLLGLFVTLGIVFYEMRNTVLYDAAIHRAKWLEVSLDLPILTQGKQRGGLFNERPDRPELFLNFQVWHHQALALVYGAAIGGWVYIVANALLSFTSQQRSEGSAVTGLAAVLAAVVAAFVVVREWHRFDSRLDKPQPNEGMQ